MKHRLLSVLDIFKSPKPIPASIYSSHTSPEGSPPQKVYLRVEPNGFGTLVINASLILHLNPVATEFAYAMIHHIDEDQIIRNIRMKYRIDQETVRRDFHSFVEKIQSLTLTEDLDPIEFYGFDRATNEVFKEISAPYRLDCAITYRLPDYSSSAYAPLERVKDELTTDDWKNILDKAWRAGIPHIVFTGGEPTLRPDLLDLILHAEQNGQICGLITDGHAFTDPQILNSFLNAGLDHVMLLLDPENDPSWKIVETIAPFDLFTAVHVTLDDQNCKHISEMISRLASIGINALSLSTNSPDQSSSLSEAADLATYHGLKLVWDLPVPYSKFNLIRLEVVDEERFDGAGITWLYIEPDGDVLPTQGIARVLGNLLTQEWSEIWEKCQSNVELQTSL